MRKTIAGTLAALGLMVLIGAAGPCDPKPPVCPPTSTSTSTPAPTDPPSTIVPPTTQPTHPPL